MVFLRLGLTAFGGPAMLPHIRRAVVRQRAWMTDEDFSRGIAAAQSIPGATAMQAAAYCGLRTRGVTGGLAAYLGFGLPAFALITLLSRLYFEYGALPRAAAAFTGLKAVVAALMAEASVAFALKYLRTPLDKILALSAGLVFAFRGSPILAIVGVCLAAVLVYRDVGDIFSERLEVKKTPKGYYPALGSVAGCLAAGAAVLFLTAPNLFGLAAMMAKVDLFAFGGGYASLPLMLHEVVEVRGIMGERMFLDGIALGQMTPGPIVMTAAFVGYHMRALAGATVGATAVFAPSFLLIALAAPNFDRLSGSVVFQRALRGSLMSLVGLLAATTGVFATAAVWDWRTILLALGAFIALRMKADVVRVVAAGAIISTLIM